MDIALREAPRHLGGEAVERLAFRIKLVSTQVEMEQAVKTRRNAYGRHVPDLAAGMTQPDTEDFEPGVVVLLATSKLDNEPVGTMRIQTNHFRSLHLEDSVTLPDWLAATSMAEATRLGVCRGRIGRVVKVALFKAYYQFCIDNNIDWMIATGRRGVDRDYRAMLMQDVFPDRDRIPMAHVGNIPHRVMAIQVQEIEPIWRNAEHALYKFFFETTHPDISVDQENVIQPQFASTPVQHSVPANSAVTLH